MSRWRHACAGKRLIPRQEETEINGIDRDRQLVIYQASRKVAKRFARQPRRKDSNRNVE